MIKFLFTILFMFHVFQVSAIEITDVTTNCPEDNNCEQLKQAFKSLKREFVDLDHVHETIKLYVANEGVQTLDYEINTLGDSLKLNIVATQKKRILELEDFKFVGGRTIEIPTVLPVKRDDYLDNRKIEQTENLIEEVAREKGYPDAEITHEIKPQKAGVTIQFTVDLKEPIWVKKINITSKSSYLKNLLATVLGVYDNQPLDLQAIKASIDETQKLIHQYGFYLTEIDLKTQFLGSKRVVLFINIKNTRSYVFFVKGLKVIQPLELKKHLATSLVAFKREMNEDNVALAVKEKFISEGFKESEIIVSKSKREKNDGETVIEYDIIANEGVKVRIDEIDFKGVSFYSKKELRELFYQNGSGLISAGVHDESFYEKFVTTLREMYISEGFVSVFIEKPFIKYLKNEEKVQVTYRVREGIRSQVRNLNISGVDGELKEKVIKIFSNHQGSYFNPIKFQEELSSLDQFLKNEGYYFTKIKNLNSKNLVVYEQDNTFVTINIEIEKGLKLFVGDVIIIGNNMTRKLLIRRELKFKKGELVTIDKIEKSQVSLLSLGIFSAVQIQPVSSDRSETDILVFVREKDFGTVEVAPGIRSDLGIKLSTTINYNNIDGMNKRISFKGSVNQRLNLYSLAPERRKSSSSLIEYDTSVNYTENHIFHSDVDFNTQILKSRRRFYSFDADIQRFTLRVSKDLTSWLNAYAKYQFETISQFDATVEREHGHFQIGSITPGLMFDFRNRPVNPTSGASFNISCEFANPAMLSQQNDELTVNYYKLINRNRFYVPLSRDVIVAMYTAFGVQQNLATNKNDEGDTEGYIPNIKVFRLNGSDIVRGYEDDEINRLVSLQDISEVEVNSRAYMANFKFEPRLMLSDVSVLGLFYDAGRIFVDEFKQDQLRSSVGLSFKYLTPVGTLDFAYGIKLLRKRDADGTLDSPGRLHVSIGFF